MGKNLSVFISIQLLFLVSCSSFKQADLLIENLQDQNSGFPFSNNISASGIANIGDETLLQIEDGASIIIPSNSIEEDVSIKLTRNPDNADDLPPLDEDVVLLSDAYNFQVNGVLNEPIDLVIPFNPELIPERDGLLVIAQLNENGWVYLPVIPDGETIVYFTKNPGTHLIAWHYVDTENEYLSYKLKAVCDPRIVVQVLNEKINNEDTITIIGSILPFTEDFNYQAEDWLTPLLSNRDVSFTSGSLPIKLTFNSFQEVYLNTDIDGSFQYQVNVFDSAFIKNGLNHVEAIASCDSLFGSTGESIGYATYNWGKSLDDTYEQISQFPEASVFLPSFIGQTVEEAKSWLDKNNFKYTWVDGSSHYDPGLVYKQIPSGEQFKVPHRTNVVLFRTIEQLSALPLSYVVNECVENFYRLVKYDHENNLGFILNEKAGSCEGEWGERISSIEKINEHILSYSWVSGETSGDIVLDLNTVAGLTNPIPTDRFIIWPIEEFSWSEDWGEGYSTPYDIQFVREETITILGHSRLALVYEGEYEEYVLFTQYDNTSIKEIRKSIFYFDKITGFNLRVEHFKWLDSCTPDCSNLAGEITGKTILELVETDWDLGSNP